MFFEGCRPLSIRGLTSRIEMTSKIKMTSRDRGIVLSGSGTMDDLALCTIRYQIETD